MTTAFDSEVLDAKVQPSTSDPCGLVSGGRLKMRGPLLPLPSAWAKTSGESARHDRISCQATWPFNGTEQDEYDCKFDNIDDLQPFPVSGTFERPTFLLVIDHHETYASYELDEARWWHRGLLLEQQQYANISAGNGTQLSIEEVDCVRIGHGRVELGPEFEMLPAYLTETVSIV
jgi:hypothetical protein